jgi:hypothetical protein
VVKLEIFKLLDTLIAVTGLTPKLPKHKHANTECPCPKCNVKTEKALIQIANA